MTFAPGTQKRLLIVGGFAFGTFAIATFAVQRWGASQEVLSIVGGAIAYAFLVIAVVILIRGWRNRSAGDRTAISAFLSDHPAVTEAVGSPVAIGSVGGDVLGRSEGQATITVPVTGPAGSGIAELVMARIGRSDWEILGGTLDAHGEEISLSSGVRSDA